MAVLLTCQIAQTHRLMIDPSSRSGFLLLSNVSLLALDRSILNRKKQPHPTHHLSHKSPICLRRSRRGKFFLPAFSSAYPQSASRSQRAEERGRTDIHAELHAKAAPFRPQEKRPASAALVSHVISALREKCRGCDRGLGLPVGSLP